MIFVNEPFWKEKIEFNQNKSTYWSNVSILKWFFMKVHVFLMQNVIHLKTKVIWLNTTFKINSTNMHKGYTHILFLNYRNIF